MKDQFNGRGAAIDLESCLFQVEASKGWFTRRVLPLSLEQLRWRPDPRRWSMAECLDHLNLTLGLYLPKVAIAIGDGWPDHRMAARPALLADEAEALRAAEPPVASPMTAPPATVPSPAVDFDKLVDRFYANRDRYADAVRKTFGLEIAAIPILDPLFPRVFSLGGTLALLAAHDRRHMWQAERVRQNGRFPGRRLIR